MCREAVGAAAAHLRGVQIRTELSRFTRKTNRLSVKDLSAFGSTSRAKQRSETGRLRHYPNFQPQVRMGGPPDLNLLEDLGFVNPWSVAR